MLSRSLRRVALDARWKLPPTYLCPWTASLTTASHPPPAETLPSSALPYSEPSTPSGQPATNVSPSSMNSSKVVAPKAKTPSSRSSTSLKTSKSPTPTELSPSTLALLPLLQAQKQIYIKAHIHARPYLLTQGDTLRLPFLMPGVSPGDVLRLNRATLLGSRDFTLRAPATHPRGKSDTSGSESLEQVEPAQGTSVTARAAVRGKVRVSSTEAAGEGQEGGMKAVNEHFIPHLAKGRIHYLDDRLFVCRAVVLGTEAEPMRTMEKTKRRQRHTRHVKSKHRYTVLRVQLLRVKGVEEIQGKSQQKMAESKAS